MVVVVVSGTVEVDDVLGIVVVSCTWGSVVVGAGTDVLGTVGVTTDVVVTTVVSTTVVVGASVVVVDSSVVVVG